jgi:L-asparaginase
VAAEPGADGVLVALAGQVWSGAEVRKVHTWRLEAFEAGDAGPVALVREGRVLPLRAWPAGRMPGALAAWPAAPGPDDLPAADEAWPWVEIVASHAGAGPRAVEALCSAGVRGLVVACTGNGSVHRALDARLRAAMDAGVPVLRATRCGAGGIIEAGTGTGTDTDTDTDADARHGRLVARADGAARLPSALGLTPGQARVELSLRLLQSTGRDPVVDA